MFSQVPALEGAAVPVLPPRRTLLSVPHSPVGALGVTLPAVPLALAPFPAVSLGCIIYSVPWGLFCPLTSEPRLCAGQVTASSWQGPWLLSALVLLDLQQCLAIPTFKN